MHRIHCPSCGAEQLAEPTNVRLGAKWYRANRCVTCGRSHATAWLSPALASSRRAARRQRALERAGQRRLFS